MKHKREWLGLWAICILLAGVIGGTAAYSSTRAEPPEVIEIGFGIPCYMFTSPKEMYENSELVVRGTYLREAEGGKPYECSMDLPTQYATLSVNRVLKGSCGDTLNFYYVGGETYIKEAIETAEKEGIDRKEFHIFPMLESTDPRANRIRRCGDNEHFVKPVAGEEYLLFLNYDPQLFQDYCVMGDMYGFLHINEQGQVYNPDTKNYDTLEMLEN